jgi:hypothetical protein
VRYLDERAPAVLPTYLARLAAPRPPRSAVATLAATYARLTGRPFSPAFGEFAAGVADEKGDRIRPVATIRPTDTTTSRVAPLAIHFVRVDRSVRSVAVKVTRGRADVRFAYRLESEVAGNPAAARRLRPRTIGGRLVFDIPPTLRRSPRFGLTTLVVANGHADRAAGYTLRAR